MRPSDFSSSSDSDKTIISPLPAAPSAGARAGRTEVRRTQPGSHFAAPQKPEASSRKGKRDESTPRNRRRVPLIVLGVIVALLVITYAGGAIIFSNVFYPGTTIAGADVSLIGPGSAAEWLAAPFVRSVGGSWMISRADVRNREWARITRLSADAVRLARASRRVEGAAGAQPAGEER